MPHAKHTPQHSGVTGDGRAQQAQATSQGVGADEMRNCANTLATADPFAIRTARYVLLVVNSEVSAVKPGIRISCLSIQPTNLSVKVW